MDFISKIASLKERVESLKSEILTEEATCKAKRRIEEYPKP